jgi:hypothetical protein
MHDLTLATEGTITKYIQFKALESDGSVKIIGTARMKGGKVVIKTTPPGLKLKLGLNRIVDGEGKHVTIDAGADYLGLLPLNFHGTYLWAAWAED